ncbi:50S ribosomal protein L4 [Patescibacteria group bacterium]|nr:50S ribosomal protein L4 [Patescibacteria group bacterium]
MKAPLYNQKGEKKGDVTLDKNVFEVEASEGLIHEYLLYQRANARRPIAHTLIKSEVSGGGRKPFRQKGTGRARQGSIRSPHMHGGGVAFGPSKERNFQVMMPKKQRQKALYGILSLKAKNGKLLALDKFELDKPKTKDFAALVAKLPVNRNVLVAYGQEEEALKKSAKNLKNAKVLDVNYLNPVDLTKYDNLLITETALKQLSTKEK